MSRTNDHRRMAIQGFDSVVGSHYFHAFLEFQVEGLRKHLRKCRGEGRNVGLFAFFLKAVGQALHEVPSLNVLVDYRTQTSGDQVDIAVPVEIVLGDRVENRQYVLRDAASKTVDAIGEELARAKDDRTRMNGFLGSREVEWLLARLPRPLVRWVFRRGLRDHRFVRRLSGTTFVTSVSMFSNVPGFVLPYAGGPKATSFAFGSVYRKAVAVGDEVKVAEVVSVTVSFNHDAVDGAPAARFVNVLRRLIEKDYAELLLIPSAPGPGATGPGCRPAIS